MQPLSTNRATVSPPAGADQPFIAARFACLALATVCFSAAAGLEGSKMGQPLIAALPGTAAAAVLAYRAKPALALTPPLTLDDVAIQEAPEPQRHVSIRGAGRQIRAGACGFQVGVV